MPAEKIAGLLERLQAELEALREREQFRTLERKRWSAFQPSPALEGR